MEQLKFAYHYQFDDMSAISFVDTEFDNVIFCIDEFEFGDKIEGTEDDALLYFNYYIVADDYPEPLENERLERFLSLLRRLVDQIVRNAVKDL